MDPNVILNRLLRLAMLDTSVFDEVRDDERETVPALVIAVVAAFLAGLGTFLWWQVVPKGDVRDGFDNIFLNSFVLGSIFLVVMYGVAVLVVYVALVQFFKAQVDLQGLIRVMGYAAWPLALSVLMFIPAIFPVFSLVPLALLFVMMIYAAQSASGADSTQVVISCLAGVVVMVFVLGIIAASSSGYGVSPDAPMGAGQFGILFDWN
ncbi:MAG: hypothetical protein IT304_06090 [Dehalococcoidia bacterium]|nr:hypothetical protein [Dehalococcoidia bacterium]